MNPEIIAETAEYFVINKPAGMATEPPSHEPTLRGWLIDNSYINKNDWAEAERYGVVHRLDADTSGVIIWAKNKAAQGKLKLEWQGRQVKKTYLALVIGECDKTGEIELSIERDNKNDKMRVAMLPTGRERIAITSYKTLATTSYSSERISLVEAHPVTGRTHQIRVHFKAIGHPLIADKLYGEKKTDEIANQLGLHRQFLHASEVCLPDGQQIVCYKIGLPTDLAKALEDTNLK